MSHRILAVVGARPNFVKMAPLVHALRERRGIEVSLVHTGQHYDHVMSDSFMGQLGLPAPDHFLGVGSGTHGEQTAAVLVGVERVLRSERADMVIVAGDVNSTLGAALAAAKERVLLGHLEAGLRSEDWSMPEEVNRAVTDRVSDLLLCHSASAVDNLLDEGVAPHRIALVGNTMIDSLFALLDRARAAGTVERLGLSPKGFVLATLHRPVVVEDPQRLADALWVLDDIAARLPVVLPAHPRTLARLEERPGLVSRVRVIEPLDYLEFVGLEAAARLVITDSGGVQEETSALGIPCLTYRTSTERPITVELGTNRLVGIDPERLRAACLQTLDAPPLTERPRIPLWDGQAGSRAADSIVAHLRGEHTTAPARSTMSDPPGRLLADRPTTV